ncbi:hypothetical protein [Streptomyces fulvoviolaceus]|uniref:hypothetical protein n=1 Tax=Streptomyces fulvoviolaceus TaxID=285535 RepID=UPI0021BFB566|nr:hypothetical protein [Streptomyces fulvoviolaceus]MCT9080676.1 hypothetical protein [Streptomyces fulvoviolaceus]
MIDIEDGEERLGSALRLTRKFALTATHCLRGHVPTDPEQSRLRLPDGTTVVVPLHNEISDLALLRLVVSDKEALPPEVYFDSAKRDESWTATYRFPAADKPPAGSVVEPDTCYRTMDGFEARAVQLSCELRKNHWRFAGSPVERVRGGGIPPVALGVIIEPQDSTWEESNEIFAGSVAEALDLFSITGLRLVLDVTALSGSHGEAVSTVVGDRDAERQTNGEGRVARILRDEDMDYYVVQLELTL